MKRLSKADLHFVLARLELPSWLRDQLVASEKLSHEIALSDKDADILRNLCADRLQTHGFDEEYEPTQEGIILEKLIDKLFIG